MRTKKTPAGGSIVKFGIFFPSWNVYWKSSKINFSPLSLVFGETRCFLLMDLWKLRKTKGEFSFAVNWIPLFYVKTGHILLKNKGVTSSHWICANCSRPIRDRRFPLWLHDGEPPSSCTSFSLLFHQSHMNQGFFSLWERANMTTVNQ